MDSRDFWDVKGLEAGTIRQMHRAVNAEGYSVSENAIRKWVKTGEIRCPVVGNRPIVTKKAILKRLGVLDDENH